MKYLTAAVFLFGFLSFSTASMRASSHGEKWRPVTRLTEKGRIDAIVYAKNGVVLIGARGEDSGHIFRSADYGKTWTHVGRPIKSEILNLLYAGGEVVLVSTFDGEVWKSEDLGKTWSLKGKIASQRIYSMVAMPDGVVLASEFRAEGGRVYKSADKGETWIEKGTVSPREVYRFERVEDGVILNGEAGHVYKSTDNGDTWTDRGQVSDAPLYATEYLENGIVLQGDGKGRIFKSEDNGNAWKQVADVGDACDDFVYMGDGVVVLSTYQGTKHLYRSTDYGDTWNDVGATPTGDVLDHVIFINDGPNKKAIGGTTEGWIIEAD